MKLAQFGSRDFLKAIRPFVGLFVVLLLFATVLAAAAALLGEEPCTST